MPRRWASGPALTRFEHSAGGARITHRPRQPIQCATGALKAVPDRDFCLVASQAESFAASFLEPEVERGVARLFPAIVPAHAAGPGFPELVSAEVVEWRRAEALVAPEAVAAVDRFFAALCRWVRAAVPESAVQRQPGPTDCA